jgi:hypothetical protein
MAGFILVNCRKFVSRKSYMKLYNVNAIEILIFEGIEIEILFFGCIDIVCMVFSIFVYNLAGVFDFICISLIRCAMKSYQRFVC